LREAKVLPDVITIEGCSLIGGDGCGAGGKYRGFSDVMVNKTAMASYPRDTGSSTMKSMETVEKWGGIGFREDGLEVVMHPAGGMRA